MHNVATGHCTGLSQTAEAPVPHSGHCARQQVCARVNSRTSKGCVFFAKEDIPDDVVWLVASLISYRSSMMIHGTCSVVREGGSEGGEESGPSTHAHMHQKERHTDTQTQRPRPRPRPRPRHRPRHRHRHRHRNRNRNRNRNRLNARVSRWCQAEVRKQNGNSCLFGPRAKKRAQSLASSRPELDRSGPTPAQEKRYESP